MRVLREGWAATWAQPVASLLTIVMVAGMCAAVLLTTGRTAAAEEAAISQIDAAGTRSIIVRAGEQADLDPGVATRIAAIDDVEHVVVLGPMVDVRNAAVPGAPPVGVRTVHSGIALPEPVAGEAAGLASAAGAEALGLADGTGVVLPDDGQHMSITGPLDVPAHLGFLQPVVAVPADPDTHAAMIVVLARSPHMVAPVAQAVTGLLAPDDPTAVTIETSAQLAQIRAAVAGELGSYSRSLVLAILAVAGVLVAANLAGLVMLRRKDFGRRRALGATQGLIIALLLTQVGLCAFIGTVLGSVGALTALATTSQPLPGAEFTGAVAVAALVTALLAALAPALAAARREPLYELRVP